MQLIAGNGMNITESVKFIHQPDDLFSVFPTDFGKLIDRKEKVECG